MSSDNQASTLTVELRNKGSLHLEVVTIVPRGTDLGDVKEIIIRQLIISLMEVLNAH